MQKIKENSENENNEKKDDEEKVKGKNITLEVQDGFLGNDKDIKGG